MSTYFIGDIHGCYNNLKTMLDCIHFNTDSDMLYLTGDLVSRGPNSLEVLQLIRNFNKKAKTVLGNHDLHLLRTYFGIEYKRFKDHFYALLHNPDTDELMHWLCHQPILHIDEDKQLLMSHAGIYPQWNINQSKLYAQEIENILTSDYPQLLFTNFTKANKLKIINTTNISIKQINQIQHNLNVFTKMRYIRNNGDLDLQYKDNPEYSPKDMYPWFNLSPIVTPTYSIIFGHWASLQHTQLPLGIYGLDSGCCWGGYLTLLRWEDKKIIQKPCSPPE